MPVGGLAGLDAVQGEFHDIRFFGLHSERGDDGVQRPHPLQRAWPRRSFAPAHRFRPWKRSDDDRQHVGEHLERSAATLFDQRDVEIAFFGVALDFRFIQRGKAGGFEKSLDRGIRTADARTPAFFFQVRLQRQPPRRRERFCAFVNQALGDELVGDQAAQIVRRLGLHARGDFLGKQFQQKIRHQTALPASV